MKNNHFLHVADNVLDWLSNSSDETLFDALAKCDDLISYAVNNYATGVFLKYNLNLIFDRSIYENLDIYDINDLGCISTDRIAVNDDPYAMAA